MLYYITVQVTRPKADGWRESFGLPTFIFDSRIDGIVSKDHAERFARHMLSAIAPGEYTIDVNSRETYD